MTLPDDQLVTVSDIAKMTGTARSTVSNWKRRHADFPSAREQTPRGPLYDRREIAEWLERRDSTAAASTTINTGLAGRIFGLADLVRGAWSSEQAALVLTRMVLGLPVPDHLREQLSPQKWEQLQSGVHDLIAAADDDREAIVRALLDTYADAGGRSGAAHVSPLHLVRFATRVLGPRAAVLDPACGAGGFLADCAATAKLVCGQELNRDMAELARARLAKLTTRHGGRSEVEAGNSLLDDRFPTLFDGVICSPPWRTKLEPGVLPQGDARWVFDYPRTSGDAAWIQHVVAHLAPGGRAVVVLPPATLFEHGVVGSVRAGLVRSGFLRAVIELPNNTLPSTGVAPVLVVLERPIEPNPKPTVLLAQPMADSMGRRTGWSFEVADSAAAEIVGWLDGRVDSDALAPDSYREVPLDKLAADDFDLTPRRHLTPTQVLVAPLIDVRAEFHQTAGAAGPELDRLRATLAAAHDLAPLEAAHAPRAALGDLVEIRRGIPMHQLADNGDFVVHSPATLIHGTEPSRYLTEDAPELQTAAPMFNAVPGDVLVSLDGQVGLVHVVTEPMFVSSAFAILRPKQHPNRSIDVEESFLGAWLRSTETQAVLQHLAKGSTIRRVAMKDLRGLSIPIPEADIQRAISDFDDKLQAAIDAVRDLAATVERLHHLGEQTVAAALPEGHL